MNPIKTSAFTAIYQDLLSSFLRRFIYTTIILSFERTEKGEKQKQHRAKILDQYRLVTIDRHRRRGMQVVVEQLNIGQHRMEQRTQMCRRAIVRVTEDFAWIPLEIELIAYRYLQFVL